MICATCYIHLFLRRIREPQLIGAFLRFLFVEKSNSGCDVAIVDAMTLRLQTSSKLCQVTLALFDTLLAFDCEDVLFWLVLRHLVPLKHLLPSQRDLIREPDLHCRAADKLLSLTPICCSAAVNADDNRGVNFASQIFRQHRSNDEDSTMNDKDENFRRYLKDAKKRVRNKSEATKCWIYAYDGIDPPINDDSKKTTCDKTPLEKEAEEFWDLVKHKEKLQFQDEFSDDEDFESNNTRVVTTIDDVDFSVNSLGPFLDALLEKVELMASNTLATNLLLTSVLSQLASYPQPLLRSALISADVVFQPSVRGGLFACIASLRRKLDNIMPTLSGSDEAVVLARRFLRDRVASSPVKSKSKATKLVSTAINVTNQHRSSLGAALSSLFGRKSTSSANSSANSSLIEVEVEDKADVASRVGFRHHHLGKEVRRQAMAAVLLEEWLLELAAIAQEHSVLMKEVAFEVGMGLKTTKVKQ